MICKITTRKYEQLIFQLEVEGDQQQQQQQPDMPQIIAFIALAWWRYVTPTKCNTRYLVIFLFSVVRPSTSVCSSKAQHEELVDWFEQEDRQKRGSYKGSYFVQCRRALTNLHNRENQKQKLQSLHQMAPPRSVRDWLQRPLTRILSDKWASSQVQFWWTCLFIWNNCMVIF